MYSIKDLEKRLGLTLPIAYKTIVNNGWTDNKGHNFLWLSEAEWVQPPEIETTEMHYSENILPGLVPFAFTGGGDHWCWWKGHTSSQNEPKILCCSHDSDMADIDAPCFASWFYRRCLIYANFVNPKDVDTVTQNLRKWGTVLEQLAPSKMSADIIEVSKKQPRQYHWGPHKMKAFGFITNDEYDERLAEYLGTEYINNEVRWVLDD